MKANEKRLMQYVMNGNYDIVKAWQWVCVHHNTVALHAIERTQPPPANDAQSKLVEFVKGRGASLSYIDAKDVITIYRNGDKIAAIKFLREATSPTLSLKDAKEAVESIELS